MNNFVFDYACEFSLYWGKQNIYDAKCFVYVYTYLGQHYTYFSSKNFSFNSISAVAHHSLIIKKYFLRMWRKFEIYLQILIWSKACCSQPYSESSRTLISTDIFLVFRKTGSPYNYDKENVNQFEDNSNKYKPDFKKFKFLTFILMKMHKLLFIMANEANYVTLTFAYKKSSQLCKYKWTLKYKGVTHVHM